MKFLRNLPTQTRRDAWVEVDLDAIEHNACVIRKTIPRSVDLMAVIKADAYGHGAVMIIPTLEASGVSIVGVAAIDEAIQIRQAGLEIPILVIGAVPDWAVQMAIEQDIQLTVFAPNHLDSLKKVYELTQKPAKVHIKVDTGMHRIGIHWQEAEAFIKACESLPFIQIEGVFSHLASANDVTFTHTQRQRFQQVLEGLDTLPPHIHLANSAGALTFPETHYNLVRLGIAFLGYGVPKALNLTPALSLKGRIVHLYDLQPGEGVSYDQSYKNTGDSSKKLAVLPIGYADGIFRALSNQMEALVQGHRVRQVGYITMDQMMFDVTDVPDLSVGETMTVIGKDSGECISLSEWAGILGTVEYELMCALRVRLPKIYTRTGGV